MNSDSSKKQVGLSLIESLPDGSFVYYPTGKQAFRFKSGRYYVDSFRSRNRADLERMARYCKWTASWGTFLFLFLSNLAATLQSLSLLAVCFVLFLVEFVILLPSTVQTKIFTILFPAVHHVTEDLGSELSQSVLLRNETRRFNPIVKILSPLLLVGLIYFAWTMIAHHRNSHFWNLLFSASPLIVLGGSFFITLMVFSWIPSLTRTWDFSRTLLPAYVALALAWMGVLSSLPGPVTYTPERTSYKMTARSGVVWRIEITQADEPKTWPFKEPSYMLGCQGIDGNYVVYLVKTPDIMYQPDRPDDFVPQLYGLKGSLAGWKEGATQLLSGQSVEVFQKYVETSLELCRKAELASKSKDPVPVKKK